MKLFLSNKCLQDSDNFDTEEKGGTKCDVYLFLHIFPDFNNSNLSYPCKEFEEVIGLAAMDMVNENI